MGLVIVGGVFALIGLPLLWLGLRALGKDRAIGRWPRAPGTIVSSQVESSTYNARDHAGYYRTYNSYWPEVRFTYTVEGVEYQGDKVAREVATTNNLRAVQACVDRYAAGAQTRVFYDPADPSVAFLETRRSIGGIIVTAFGSLFSAIGLLLLTLYFVL